MLHIILFLLKIIGILLAALLGIVLLLIGLILFVPIRYRANAEKSEKLSVRFIGSWLLHLFHLSICYDGEVPVIKLRVAGIPLFDSTKEKKAKKQKKKTKKEKKPKEHAVRKKQREESEELVQTMELKSEDFNSEEENLNLQKEENHRIEAKEIEKTIEQDKKVPDDNIENPLLEKNKESSSHEKMEETLSLWKKIVQFVSYVKSLIMQLPEKFQKVKETIRNVRDTCSKLRNKFVTLKEFIAQEDNKKGFSTVFGSVVQLLKKIGPVVIRGKIRFGTGDPCSTGQALGALGICYGWFGRWLEIEPDFENEVLEGTLFMKGRFQIISLLIIGIKLLREKGFQQLRKNIRTLKEEI